MKIWNSVKNAGKKALMTVVGLTVAGAAMATPGPYDDITSAVDWSDVKTAIVAIAALIAAVLVVKRGVKFLLGLIGR